MGEVKIHTRIKKLGLVEKRQGEVFKAAAKLFVKQGYHATSIRDIARESGLGIGPLYDYFKNKEAILFYVQKRAVEENHEMIKNILSDNLDPVETLKLFIVTQVGWFMNNQDLFLFIYKEGHLLNRDMRNETIGIERKTISMLEAVLKKGQEMKVFRQFDSRIAANMIILMTHGWILKRWDLKDVSGSQLDFTLNFIMNAICEKRAGDAGAEKSAV